jgi:hypothetical protein
MRLKFLAILIFFALAGTALCQLADSNASLQTANDIARHPNQLELFAIILIMVLFAGVPLLLNMYMAHKHLTEMHRTLSEFVKGQHPGISEDKLMQLMQDCMKADPSGAPGTTRGVMALSVTLIVGICLFFLLTYPPDNEIISQNIKEVLLTLTGALTSIIGFFFGGKASEAGQSPASPSSGEKPPANPLPGE